MNIFQQYGIKEVADVCLYAIELDENDDEVYIPVLYLDTLKVSTVEQTAESTSANGGTGNPKLITWDYGKDITVTLEDALFSPASQGMMWGGKMGAKTLKLYLRNFYDKGTDPDENTASVDELNAALRGAVMTVETFSDFCIIPERYPSYEMKKNRKNQHTSGYVGGTSIYCWLVDANIISSDGQKRVRVNDLILFYREQTQKWYFFNGRGPEQWYKDSFDTSEKNHYAIGYQYGRETFEWIKKNIAEWKFGIYRIYKEKQKIVGNETGVWLNRVRDNDTDKEFESEFIYAEYVDGQIIVDGKVVRDNVYYNLPIKEDTSEIQMVASSSRQAYIFSFLTDIGLGEVDKERHTYRQKANFSVNEWSGTLMRSELTGAWVYYYHLDKASKAEDGTWSGGVTIGNKHYTIELPLSDRNRKNITEYVVEHLQLETLDEDDNKDVAIPSWTEYEEVAKKTIDSWTENPPCAKYDRGPDYTYGDGLLNFLTQQLYIDGFRTDKCARNKNFADMTVQELTDYLSNGTQPYRYKASIDVEYNTNIAPPQEAIYQVDHDVRNVFYLDRIEKCRATSRFCIDTDVNLKHGQYRYLQQYAQTELTVYIDPKTMQPYEPNTFEYYRKNGQRITGNLRAFKQHEIYYKWTRTKAYERQSLGNQIIIDATHFPGTYRLVGETMARSRKTGKDQRYQFEIPLCKLSADTNLTLQADGDPTTFTMSLTALRRYDGVMMKLTMYDVEEKKYGKNISGSTQIIPQAIDPEPELVNAPWDSVNEHYPFADFEVEATEYRDLANNILHADDGTPITELDGLYKSLNKIDDSAITATAVGFIRTVTTNARRDSTEEEPIKGKSFETITPMEKLTLNPEDYQAMLF